METTGVINKDQPSIDNIVNIIISYLHPERIILFGSRAEGKGKRYSDFDIALEGIAVDIRRERLLKEALDEKLGIFSVDLINLDKADKGFRKIVLEKGRIIYER